MKKTNLLYLLMALLFSASWLSADDSLPKPDGKPADMSKPVQVFIIMGQSNTLEMGKVTPAFKELYPFLYDESGKESVCQDVRNVSVMQKNDNMNVYRNEWLSLAGKNKIGIETGIGHQLGAAIDAPVMILKSSIGNRSLGWDLLPPGSKQYDFTPTEGKEAGKELTFAGYKESPLSWPKGTTPEKISWYAGLQYDADVGNAKKVLADLDKYYPGAKSYEVAGFLWWQGDKDRYNEAHATKYEENLVNLIKSLRNDFNAPKAKFVCATLGQTDKDDAKNKNEAKILAAKMAVDGNSGKYPEFKDNVSTVYTHPMVKDGGASNGHYNGNGETYMSVGLAMGKAMAELLKK